MAKRLTVQKDLKQIFPKEFANRELIGKFIDYVMNHFFQSSNEEYINGYIGKKTVAMENGDFYIPEATKERQNYQLTPTVVTSNNQNVVDYCNFINTLQLQGCDINDQNRLLSGEYWSWCPPINIDMFLNYNFYYWIEEGIDPIELTNATNVLQDIIGKESYTYTVNEETKETIEFSSGLRIIFKNDANPEYNDIIYIVEGVGNAIRLVNDDEKYPFVSETPEYFVMERGCKDGNAWSKCNRWFHRSLVSKTALKGAKKYYQANKPIICFNKDIELYQHGSFNRGMVDLYIEDVKSNIHGLAPQDTQGVKLKDGMTILLVNDKKEESSNQLFQITGIESLNTVILQPLVNGQSIDGKSTNGEGITITKGKYAGNYYYFENGSWKLGQQKQSKNQSPLFQLYDANKISLSNTLEYPQTSFKGCKLFDYVDTDVEGAVYDEDLNRYILTNGYGNYKFQNRLTTQRITYYDYDTLVEYDGFRFFKINGEDIYLNNWYFSNNVSSQYITTEITVTDNRTIIEKETEEGFKYKYTMYKLAYEPMKMNNRKTLFVYLNGTLLNENIDYNVEGKELLISENIVLNVDDSIYVKIMVEKLNEPIVDGYYFDLPLSLTSNGLNKNVEDINYNECFDHMKSIIENQTNFSGMSSGSNNYINTKQDQSLGTEILQHSNSVIRTMLLNANEYTDVRNVLEYITDEYSKFKVRFINVLTEMSNNGEYNEYTVTDSYDRETDVEEMVQKILAKVNIGKEGLKPFYNNGVANYYGECYIPATPAYLGLDKCYKPEIVEVNENFKTQEMLLCHDGSYTSLFGDYRDKALLFLEEMIYESIPSKWKEAHPYYNKYKFIPGKFRKTAYSKVEYTTILSQFLEKWSAENNLNYADNKNYVYDNPFTWNYSICVDKDGEQLNGSYKSIYLYYYDTYRPHTHPWEMLGFGSMPIWWEEKYGKAPYNSNNYPMWKDIENGYIAEGVNKGFHTEFKREGLFEKYLPVNDKGELLSPKDAGIITKEPGTYDASQPWVAGDMGEIETVWTMTSEYRYALQTILYIMRPIEWVETNWDTLNRTEWFADTNYKQTLLLDTGKRPSLDDVYMHNESQNGLLVRKIGIQQWFSDYLINENINVTTYIAEQLRSANICLSYRCGRYFKQDSIKLISDNYGIIPNQNYTIKLQKSKTNKQYGYSAIVITKVSNGYMIDGYDLSNPYFNVLIPEYSGKKTSIDINGKNVVYYNVWKQDDIQKVKYKTVFKSVQELFNVICGYGKYLENIEGWIFNKVLSDSGTTINFNAKAEDFVRWVSFKPSEGQLIMLNPGYMGMVIAHDGFLDKVGQYNNGNWSITDSLGNPIYNDEIQVYRHNGYTEITTKEKVITSLRVSPIEHEHVIILDNKTIYGDLLYDSLLCVKTSRLKISGIGIGNWDGTLTAPGYLITDDGAIANYDKLVDDFRYFFDTDDVRAQSLFGDYAKKTIGYQKLPNMERLLIDDRNMFDFYKGMLKEKGTRRAFNKLNRSTYIMSSKGASIDLYENWAFKHGEFGNTSDNYMLEFKIESKDVIQNPQLISFTTSEHADENEANITIHWNDKNWYKYLAQKDQNTFEWSNNPKLYPTGGFVQPSDVNYMVADMSEFENVKGDMKIGETIWVIKTASRDWAVYKRIKDGFVSMRVNSDDEIEELKPYLENGDLIYVSKIVLWNSREKFTDPKGLMNRQENITESNAWAIFKCIDLEQEITDENGVRHYELYRVQNRVPDTTILDKCYLINDRTDESLAQIQLYDPLQGVIPNNVLDEIQYISAQDPVRDYQDFYKWGDEKIGCLWWDLSKVRYVDYHQGDIKYRRNNWGKQLPGSEIAIMEWTSSTTLPEEGIKYVEKEMFNYETSSYEKRYYYWLKNASEVPSVDFRKKSALYISNVINSPQDEGIIWLAPIDVQIGRYKHSTFLIGNFDNVTVGEDFVIQMNFKKDEHLNEHVEWVLVREGDDDLIPEYLWSQMKWSLIGQNNLGEMVPNPELNDRNKLGISIRPRQSMFKEMVEARRNFVDVVNEILNTRDVTMTTDVGSELFEQYFMDKSDLPSFDYDFESSFDMNMVEDVALIGKKLLVNHDENYNGIWTLWEMTNLHEFTLIDYQKYDVQKYWQYVDLYKSPEYVYRQPISGINTREDINNNMNKFVEGDLFKISSNDGLWELYEFKGMSGNSPVIAKVGMENGAINLLSNIYDFLNNDSLKDQTYINGMSKYDYLLQETMIVLRKIIEYFEN